MSRESVVGRMFDAFNRGALSAAMDVFHPEVELVPLRAALEGTSYRGHDGVRQFDADAAESFPSLRIEVTDVRELGEDILVRGRLHGQSRETGMDVTADLAWVVAFEADQVIRLVTYTDAAKAFEAVGLQE